MTAFSATTRSPAFLTGLQTGYQTLFAETRSPFDPLAPADENKNGLRTLLAKLPGFSEADLSRFQTLWTTRSWIRS